ncbi:MAG: efflux RND transporter periplasmic adaptor subunit [Pseudomonadota bacterium]
MRLQGSHLVAIGILAAIGGWMLTGNVVVGGRADPDAQTIEQREESRTAQLFRVRVTDIQPVQRKATLDIRGRTQADSIVSVRAETGGTVRQRPVAKGDDVKPGDLLCVIDDGVRNTTVDQARAALSQAEADFAANETLADRGFTTKSQMRALKTALDSARAALAAAEQDMKRTRIVATAAGTVQKPFAEPGDNLRAGDVCVTLMNTNPMLFTGQVSERDVAKISLGMKADVRLVTGETVTGELRFIAPAADAQTRTFAIEVAMPNEDGRLRDGMTAFANMTLEPVDAYRLDSSWVTLADDGQIGVRVVDAENKVAFVPVKILAQDTSHIWVTGLSTGQRVITLGQNYVKAGEVVEPVTAEQAGNIQDTPAAAAQETNS